MLPRWASEAEERPAKRTSSSNRAPVQGMGSSKRAKPGPAPAPDHDYDGLTAGLDGFFGKTQGHRGMRDNAKSTRGVLKKVMLACISTSMVQFLWFSSDVGQMVMVGPMTLAKRMHEGMHACMSLDCHTSRLAAVLWCSAVQMGQSIRDVAMCFLTHPCTDDVRCIVKDRTTGHGGCMRAGSVWGAGGVTWGWGLPICALG